MRKISVVPVKSCRKVISDGNRGIAAEVGLHGFCTDEKSRAYIKFTDLASGFHAKLLRDDKGRLDSVELDFNGDDGIIMLADALDFAAKALSKLMIEEDV